MFETCLQSTTDRCSTGERHVGRSSFLGHETQQRAVQGNNRDDNDMYLLKKFLIVHPSAHIALKLKDFTRIIVKTQP